MSMKRRPILAVLPALLGSSLGVVQPATPAAPSPNAAMPSNPPISQPIRIRITHGSSVLTATLEGSPSAADFASMLPLSLTLEDYAATEKIAYLPRKLTTAGAPAGVDPTVGDIAYYAPWGNLAIFYCEAAFAKGLIRLGRLDGDVAALQRLGRTSVRVERVD